ncbi:MAG: phosphate ABC transporter permease subunit PstC [Chloroflexota bacterium]|jgi:phosphate transport system permease protein|nr:phosphate ABC transporter permease subunit PstC [Chloroflexota bacterium]MDP6758296.1 phosphate ABC transporter permease subunit PstC [Chloroflexota bacterium]
MALRTAPPDQPNPGLPAQLAPNRRRVITERIVHGLLFGAAALSVLTTAGIIITLLGETVQFFRDVSVFEFITGTRWTPLFASKDFGVLPLVNGTLAVALVAMVVAIPVGLLTAVFLSEYAPPRLRSILKPALEILAGIPTVVYGYFALLFVTPILRSFLPDTQVFNVASAGIVMGFMILPMMASIAEDALRAVPAGLREGAYALGATRFETITRVVLPGALSGILAAVILSVSRAIGETMIVSIAAGQQPKMGFDLLSSMETMTAYIVQVSLGDTPQDTIEFRTIFAVGTLLFTMTFVMNLLGDWFVRRYREVYE